MAGAAMIEAARARGDLYRFLGGLFLDPPGHEAVDQLLRAEVLDGIAAAYGEAAVAPLRSVRADADAVRGEFDRLFRVPLEGFVPACESVFRDAPPEGSGQKPTLYGPACRAVAESMREAGAGLPEGRTEPPDHVGMELLFLAYLCGEERKAREQDNPNALQRWLGREIHFLRNHPGTWFESFAEKVRTSVPDGFFAAVASLLEAVTARDLQLLEGV